MFRLKVGLQTCRFKVRESLVLGDLAKRPNVNNFDDNQIHVFSKADRFLIASSQLEVATYGIQRQLAPRASAVVRATYKFIETDGEHQP